MTNSIRSLCFIAVMFVLITSCKKTPPPCTTITALEGHDHHLVDLSILSGQPEFADLLAAHPELQAYRAFFEDSVYGMHCHVFYKDVIVFTSNYALFKGIRKDNPVVQASGEIPNDINISLSPSISPDSAIHIAKAEQNYTRTCINYQLGIYDMNAGSSSNTPLPKDYRLVWNITGNGDYPVVRLDAQDGKIYYSFDGLME